MGEMTAQFVADVLRRRHGPPEWATFVEMRNSTGFPGQERRIDVWTMNTWPSNGFRTLAYEIKVVRSDWLSELKNPAKRQDAMALASEFWYIAPAGVIKETEVPDDCGYMTVSENGKCKRIVAAKQRKLDAFPLGFAAMLLRRSLDAVVEARNAKDTIILDGEARTDRELDEWACERAKHDIESAKRQGEWEGRTKLRQEVGPTLSLGAEIKRMMGVSYSDPCPTLDQFQEWFQGARPRMSALVRRNLEQANKAISELLAEPIEGE